MQIQSFVQALLALPDAQVVVTDGRRNVFAGVFDQDIAANLPQQETIIVVYQQFDSPEFQFQAFQFKDGTLVDSWRTGDGQRIGDALGVELPGRHLFFSTSGPGPYIAAQPKPKPAVKTVSRAATSGDLAAALTV